MDGLVDFFYFKFTMMIIYFLSLIKLQATCFAKYEVVKV